MESDDDMVDVSPSGNFALAGYSDSKTKVDRIDVIGFDNRAYLRGLGFA